MSTLAIIIGTVGVATLLILVCLGLVALAKAVLPHDPPPLEEGESIHSRLVKLPPPVRRTVPW